MRAACDGGMKMQPGGLLWLLIHELRLGWRNWWGAMRLRGVWPIIFYAVLAVLLLFGGFWIARVLAMASPTPGQGALLGVTGVFALIATFMLAQALVSVIGAVYQRGDLDLLLSSPLSPWRVLIVRMAGVALNVAAFYLVLLGAVFVWLPLHGGWGWMGLFPSVLALALAVTALGLVLARVLFKLLGPARTRLAAQILGSLIGAGFFLFYQFNIATGERDVLFDRIAAFVRGVDWDLNSVFFIPARAALGDPAALAIWLGFAFCAYALAVWWFAAPFVADAAAVAGLGVRRKRDARKRRFQGGLSLTLVRKEWRLLARDPMLIVQVLLPLLYFAPLVWLQWRALDLDGVQGLAIGSMAGVFVYIASMLAANLVWFTVSAEDAPDLIAAAPVSRARVEYAKAFAAGSPAALLMFVPAIVVARISPMAGAWLWLGGAAAIASTCLIGVWRQQPGSRKNFRRRTPRTLGTSFGQFFVNFCWASATGFAVGGVALLGLIPGLIAIGLLLALQDEDADKKTAAAKAKVRSVGAA